MTEAATKLSWQSDQFENENFEQNKRYVEDTTPTHSFLLTC